MPGRYPARVSDHGFWAVQSLVTDPGLAAAAIDRLPSDLGALRAASQQLVFHYRAGGDYAENGIDPGRIAEIDTRYADAMLARLAELAGPPLTAERPARQRLVGCCRDFTVLFLAIARHRASRPGPGSGSPATSCPAGLSITWWPRSGTPAEQRWRLVDPELADGHTGGSDPAPVDPLDVPASRFLTGPHAWRACRASEADPERFAVDPDLKIPVPEAGRTSGTTWSTTWPR